MINLRDYQETAVSKIRAVFKRAILSVLLVIPTGGGKTVIFTYIAQAMSLKKKRALILVHRVELLRQTSAALSKFDVGHGMINPLYTPSFDNYVQVASVQTIIKRLDYLNTIGWIPDVIIVDEAHHATAGSWRKIIEYFRELHPKLKVLGVTATPIRTDGQGLGSHHDGIFEEMVIGPTTKWLTDEGFLVRAKVLSPPKQFDSSTLRKRGRGDYNKNDIENLINKPTITGDVVEHWRTVCEHQPTIVFCATVKHAEQVAAEFRSHGYKFYALDGNTDDDIRKRMLQGLADGTIEGVCSCDLISEGTDVPAATCAISLRLTASLSLAIQQPGRVLRPVYAPGFDLSTREGRLAAIAASIKPFAYYLDHVGNTGSWVDGEFVLNHGLPEQEHDWSLDGEIKSGKKKQASENFAIQQCLSCFAVHEPAPACPECGHIYEIKDRAPKQAEGQLQEITAEMAAALAEKKKVERMEIGKAKTYAELEQIAKERGFNPKWAGVQWGIKKKQQAATEARKFEKLQALQPIEQIEMFNEDLSF